MRNLFLIVLITVELILPLIACGANDPTTQPVILNHPAPGTIIDGYHIKFQKGMGGYGIYVNGSTNVVIRNCTVDGFVFNIALTGGNAGAQIYNNTIINSTSGGTDDSSGLYTEGMNNYSVHDNVIANNGWWVGYNVNDPVQRTAANRHHGWYSNESAGTTDNGSFYNNLVIDNVGSNVGSRKGGVFTGNVFRPGGDWDLIAASLGGNILVQGNVFFAPRLDAVPYYGGGINAIGSGLVSGNYFSGSAAITNNPCAINTAGQVIQQVGIWPKPGATLVKPGTPALTLEAYFNTIDVYQKIRPGQTTDIIRWFVAGSH